MLIKNIKHQDLFIPSLTRGWVTFSLLFVSAYVCVCLSVKTILANRWGNLMIKVKEALIDAQGHR